MAMNMATVVMKDDPKVTPESVIRLKLHLDKQRLIANEGMQLCRFVIITDYTLEDFSNVYEDDPAVETPVKFLFVKSDEVPHPSFHQRHVWKNDLFGSQDKTMFIDANTIPMGLCHSILFSSLPDKGDPSHSSYALNDEQKAEIIDNNYASISGQLDWTNTESTTLMPYFYQFVYGEHSEFVAKMFDDEVISKYGTFMEFLDEEYSEFVIPMEPGIIGKYYVRDRAKNDLLNDAWEENVRPHFPENWRGIGGEEESKYINHNHDYRDWSRQCSLVYLDTGENDTPAENDYWLRMRLL